MVSRYLAFPEYSQATLDSTSVMARYGVVFVNSMSDIYSSLSRCQQHIVTSNGNLSTVDSDTTLFHTLYNIATNCRHVVNYFIFCNIYYQMYVCKKNVFMFTKMAPTALMQTPNNM